MHARLLSRQPRVLTNPSLMRGHEIHCTAHTQGDSITEAWRGKDRGEDCFGTRCDGVPALWERNFGHLRARAFGIGGDRTEHLLWRMQNGETDNVAPKVVVLHIGPCRLFPLPPSCTSRSSLRSRSHLRVPSR